MGNCKIVKKIEKISTKLGGINLDLKNMKKLVKLDNLQKRKKSEKPKIFATLVGTTSILILES